MYNENDNQLSGNVVRELKRARGCNFMDNLYILINVDKCRYNLDVVEYKTVNAA